MGCNQWKKKQALKKISSVLPLPLWFFFSLLPSSPSLVLLLLAPLFFLSSFSSSSPFSLVSLLFSLSSLPRFHPATKPTQPHDASTVHLLSFFPLQTESSSPFITLLLSPSLFISSSSSFSSSPIHPVPLSSTSSSLLFSRSQLLYKKTKPNPNSHVTSPSHLLPFPCATPNTTGHHLLHRTVPLPPALPLSRPTSSPDHPLPVTVLTARPRAPKTPLFNVVHARPSPPRPVAHSTVREPVNRPSPPAPPSIPSCHDPAAALSTPFHGKTPLEPPPPLGSPTPANPRLIEAIGHLLSLRRVFPRRHLQRNHSGEGH